MKKQKTLFFLREHEVRNPGKTYFFARPDGSVFACKLREATEAKKKNKLVGVSDGSVFYNHLKAAAKIHDAMLGKYEDDMETLEEELEDGDITQAAYRKRKSVLSKLRKKISTDAQTSFREASKLEEDAARGKLEVIENIDCRVYGNVHGDGGVFANIQSLIV